MKRKLLPAAALIAAMVLFSTGCGNPAGGDTGNISAAFTSLEANGSPTTATTTVLTLTFDKGITALAAGDITLAPNETGAVKGELLSKGGGVYELAVTGISAEGQINVSVSRDGYNISPANLPVDVYYHSDPSNIDVSFDSLVADGEAGVTTTTKLTLTFSEDIEGLTEADITIPPNSTGAVKGALTPKGGGVYELAVSGINAAGDVTVKIEKDGYSITTDSQNVSVFYYTPPPPPVNVTFTGIIADGEAGVTTTTKLTLTFSEDIEGLTEADITIPPNNTGAVKGALTPKGGGVYELAVSGINAEGQINVSVSRPGYDISDASKNVDVHYYTSPNTGIDIGEPSVKLYLNDSESPLAEGKATNIDHGDGTYTVSVTDGTYIEIIWYLNGTLIDKALMKQSLVLSKQKDGNYFVTVEVREAGGGKNTGSHTFVVQ